MKIEICCGSYEDVLAAQAGGADRAELCSALFFGGLSPSAGTFLMAQETGLPIAAMVRPREGGFCYSGAEFETMCRDAEFFIEHGAEGIVFGCLNRDGTVDEEKTAILCALAGGRCKAVFHRAFDLCKTPAEETAEQLYRLGVGRILTSGKRAAAAEGAAVIAALRRQMAGRMEILPGSGIRPHTVARLLAETGCDQIHASALEDACDPTALLCPEIPFTGLRAPAQGVYRVGSTEKTAALVAAAREGSR